MFLHVSVSHSVHRGAWYPSTPCSSPGGGCIPACLAVLQGGVFQHALQVSRPTPRGKVEGSGLGVSSPHPGGRLMGLARGVSRPIPRGGVSQHALRPPADGFCCGQYASYWNAFLFFKDLCPGKGQTGQI